MNPDTLQPLSRKQRRAARRHPDGADPHAGHVVADRAQSSRKPDLSGTSHVGVGPNAVFDNRSAGSSNNRWRDDMLTSLNKAVNQDKNSDWNIQKGSAPGIKYKGGRPPPPPVWSYSRDDLRAFQKWQRKVGIWQIQVAAYLPPNEAAMQLYCSLRGEAEEEPEWADDERINRNDGVQYILDTLRKPLMTRAVYLKRRYWHEYDYYIQRSANESVRQFCNRYHRVERSLHSVGLSIGSMYDDESRGARLLDRLRLGLDQQRLILVAS